jgi:secondary thiamine-phosphate synthase enzyme
MAEGQGAMERVEIRTQARSGHVEVTRQVEEIVARSGLRRGIAVVCSLHTTAGVTINENADPDVMEDVMAALAGMAPRGASYAHTEGNSDAHIKASLVGLSVTVPVEEGRLVLGRWQGIFFCEFDGPRRRVVGVQVVAG